MWKCFLLFFRESGELAGAQELTDLGLTRLYQTTDVPMFTTPQHKQNLLGLPKHYAACVATHVANILHVSSQLNQALGKQAPATTWAQRKEIMCLSGAGRCAENAGLRYVLKQTRRNLVDL